MKDFDLNSDYKFLPIASGTVITIALMVLIMSTSGEWRNSASSLGGEDLASPFWIFTTGAAWIFSLAVGCALAVFMARPQRAFQGAMYGLTIWSAAYLFIGGLILTMIRPLPSFAYEDVMSKLVWGGFVADLLGLSTAVLAGIAGTLLLQSSMTNRAKHEVTANRMGPSELAANLGPVAD